MVDLSTILTQLEFRLSGGEDNINPFNSLGGAMSNAIPDAYIVDGTFDNIWDDITVQERLAGDISYRWIYFYNNSLETIFDLRMYFLQLDSFVSATFHKGGPMVVPALQPNEHTRPPNQEVGSPTGSPIAYGGITDHFETTQEHIPVLGPLQWHAISLLRVIPVGTDSHLEAEYKLIIESRA
jgi:hypothetical protein